MSNWKPIKTAPKDGSRILFYDSSANGKVFAGVWDAKFEITGVTISRTKYRGAWTDYRVASFGYEEYCEYSPTHWMPLPEPPTL